jgi:FKBP-type peptidyl-prolyl cis-trans isomerase
MNRIFTNGLLLLFITACFIGLNGCAGSTENVHAQRGLEEPRVEGDTLYLSSGVKYVYMKKGSGAYIDSLAAVKTHINLIIKEDTVWSTHAPGQQILDLVAKQTALIDGFDEVIMYLRQGDRVLAVVPPELGYGEADYGGGLIPGNSTLFFDLDVVEVNPYDTAAVTKP